MNSRLSPALARSPQGQVYYCACKDRVTMRFKERWFAFERNGLAGFRHELSRLIGDRALLAGLMEEARGEALRRNESTENLPTVEDFHEMLDLVDTALLVLEAQAVVGKT